MMKALNRALCAAIVLAGAATSAQAQNLLTNGNFETGTYAGWSVNTQAGSNGALSIAPNNGGTSPISGFSYAQNPNGGNFFSITDQSGGGSYSLIQAFTLGSAQKVTISFDMFANNQAGAVYANGRDYTTVPNQNATADLLVAGADPFTNNASDIVSVFYPEGADAGANPNPWTHYSSTLSLGAGTYQLRFAETDNQFYFQQGVDNASVTATNAGVPEPATWAMMLVGFGMVGAGLRYRRKSTTARFA